MTYIYVLFIGRSWDQYSERLQICREDLLTESLEKLLVLVSYLVATAYSLAWDIHKDFGSPKVHGCGPWSSEPFQIPECMSPVTIIMRLHRYSFRDDKGVTNRLRTDSPVGTYNCLRRSVIV